MRTTLVSDAARRLASALTYRDFRLLWLGALTSSIGTWMHKVAQAWLLVTMTGDQSAFYLGLDVFLGELPILLLTILGGVVADRYNRRLLLFLSQCVQMSTAFALTALVYTGHVQIWHVLSLAVLNGVAQAFGGPAYQSLLPSLVSKNDLPNAIALNSIQFNLARVIGPVVAGLALATLGMVACFALNGLSFLVVMAAIVSLRVAHLPLSTGERLGDQLRTGLSYVGARPELLLLMLLGFVSAFFGIPLLTFLPIVARDVFQQDVGLYAHLMTFSGAGAVLGALIVAWTGRHPHMGRLLLGVQIAFGLTTVAFAASRVVPLSAVLLFVAGALLVMCFSLTTSLVQLLAPAALRGRVLSIYMVAFRGGSPLGGLAGGWLITALGSAPIYLAINGLIMVSVASLLLTRRYRLGEGALDPAA